MIQIDTKIVDERYSDRLSVIPWEAMEVSDPQALQDKADEFSTFLNQEARPTEFTIGEMGDYLRRYVLLLMLLLLLMLINIVFSEEFMAARAAFAEELRPKTIVIKDRTLRNNYASAYAVRICISCVFSLSLLLLMRLPQSLHVL